MGCSTINNREAKEPLITVGDIQDIWEQIKAMRKQMTELKAQFDLMQSIQTGQTYKLNGHINSIKAHYEGQGLEDVWK